MGVRPKAQHTYKQPEFCVLTAAPGHLGDLLPDRTAVPRSDQPRAPTVPGYQPARHPRCPLLKRPQHCPWPTGMQNVGRLLGNPGLGGRSVPTGGVGIRLPPGKCRRPKQQQQRARCWTALTAAAAAVYPQPCGVACLPPARRACSTCEPFVGRWFYIYRGRKGKG